MQDTLTFPRLGSSPRFAFPDLTTSVDGHEVSSLYRSTELSSTTVTAPSTPFVSAPSSPRSMQGFYFSAPTSPTWAALIMQDAGRHEERIWDDVSGINCYGNGCCPQKHTMSSYMWAQKREQMNGTGSPRRACQTEDHSRGEYAITEHTRTGNARAEDSLRQEASNTFQWHARTEYHGAEYYKAEHTKTGDAQTEHTIAPAEHSPIVHADARIEHIRSRDAKREHTIAKTEHFPALPPTTEYYRAEDARTQHPRSADAGREHTTAENAKTEHPPTGHNRTEYSRPRHPRTSHSKPLLPFIITNAHTLKRLHKDTEEIDASYSRNSFYASAVPFAWEEKPGTPKAGVRSAALPDANNGEEDSSSILLSGSSEFEFGSSRFSELLDPPMSPTPITASFKHHVLAWSPSPEVAQKTENLEAAPNHQTFPLRPPPRLDNAVLSVRQLLRDDAHEESKRGHRSMSSLSVPQSPKSPHKFDVRGVLRGMFGHTDAGFDPFVTAMEKMASSSDDMVKNVNKKNINKHHRRTQSASPVQVFHLDDLLPESNPSSDGSSCKYEVKNKHPIQREINARNDSFGSTPKGSKRWSFKGFLHRRNSSQQVLLQHTSLRGLQVSSGRNSSCSSSSMAEVASMDFDADDNTKVRPCVSSSGNGLLSVVSTPSSPFSSSSSGNFTSGKTSASGHKATKSPYALRYATQKAHTEGPRKKTFVPLRQGWFGCLGLHSKSYKALATLSKPLQPVS